MENEFRPKKVCNIVKKQLYLSYRKLLLINNASKMFNVEKKEKENATFFLCREVFFLQCRENRVCNSLQQNAVMISLWITK